MASRFFHVQHEFRAGTAQKWFETVQRALAPGGGWDEAVTRNLEAGYYNHSFNPLVWKAPPASGRYVRASAMLNSRPSSMAPTVLIWRPALC